MTHATRAESLGGAIEALTKQAQEGFDWTPSMGRQLAVALEAVEAEDVFKAERACRDAIEQLTGERAACFVR